MYKLHENYYHRKCYFEREQVPTQTVMKNKMNPPLANVYFKSMTPKLKVLAGLEPPMKGGGTEWYMPPKDLLKSKAVLKPVKKEHLFKLGFNGIDFFGEKIMQDHQDSMEEEKRRVLLESDINWKNTIVASCRQQWEDTSKEEALKNTQKIQDAFQEFTTLYTTSITKIEELLFDAAKQEIEAVRNKAFNDMHKKYEKLVKDQATMLYDRYTEKLMKEKARLKSEFINAVEESRTSMGNRLHDINVEKHVAVEKLRNLLECQNLACQIYVALKEREECEKEIDLSKHEHKKRVKLLKEQIAMKDFEIQLELEKEAKRQEFIKIWKKKICHVVKKFQMFVGYCLHTLPDHAEFFINMEKLMLLQLNEAAEDPSVESIIVAEKDEFHTPVPRPHPFFLCSDKGYKPQLDQNLCPKHCTSSASQMPVVVVNKRCIYAACDNFELYTDKVTQFIHGHRGDDIDLDDDHDYKFDVPIKYTKKQMRQEIKQGSSLMQILQEDIANVNQFSTYCCACRLPYCFCSPLRATKAAMSEGATPEKISTRTVPSVGRLIETRSVELAHEREPKWDSYLEYVEPKKCRCANTAKKHLREHMPVYMRNMSPYDAPDLPHYEICPLRTLKKLVKKARGIKSPPPSPAKVPSKTKDVCTQYSDNEFDNLCACFSDDEFVKLFQTLDKGSKMFDMDAKTCDVVDGSVEGSYLSKTASSFATQRAYSLRNILDAEPDLEELFKKEGCSFD